jgi:WS/DGAT/MGAT family acyltransferase
MHQLTAQDAQFLYMEDADIVANVSGAYFFDQSTAPGGVVRFKEIRKRIEERLDDCPFFRRKLLRVPMELDFPYWVEDPHFDIEYHVHHARLPKPADWRQFCILFARYHSRPLDMGRPLWEIYVVEGLDHVDGFPKGSFAMISKVHHAAVDGVAGLQMLGALMDLSPTGPPAFKYPPLNRFSGDAPTIAEIMARAAVNNARSPLGLARAAAKASPQIAQAIAALRGARPAAAGGVPRSPFNAPVSPRKAFDGAEFDLVDIKTIRTAYPEAKVNDVILATVGGGIRRYLAAKDKLPKESLIAVVPINARTGADAPSKAGGGNKITAMTTPLHTQMAHPVERLKAIVRSTRRSKAARDGLGARLMMDLAQHAPASVLALASRFIAQGVADGRLMANLVVSNVPGPQAPLYFCGARMIAMHAMAPVGDGMGLFIATPSYNGKVAVCLTSTREIIPDTPFFIGCLRQSFNELTTAAERRLSAAKAGSGGTKKRRPGKKPKPAPAAKQNGAGKAAVWT